MVTTKLTSKRKMRNTLFICFLIILGLIGRLGYIQFVKRWRIRNTCISTTKQAGRSDIDAGIP